MVPAKAGSGGAEYQCAPPPLRDEAPNRTQEIGRTKQYEARTGARTQKFDTTVAASSLLPTRSFNYRRSGAKQVIAALP